MREFKRTNTSDQDLSQLQQRLGEFFQPLITNPLLDGVLITDVSLSSVETKVEHKLRRKPIGYIVVAKNADANVWTSDDKLSTAYLTLQASAAVTVSLWVF